MPKNINKKTISEVFDISDVTITKTYKKIYISLWDDHFRQLFLSLKNEINSLFKLFNLFFDNYNYRVV